MKIKKEETKAREKRKKELSKERDKDSIKEIENGEIYKKRGNFF